MSKRKPSTAAAPYGIAACSLVITEGGRELQLTPAGKFRARDGRPYDAPDWYIDAELAQRLIAAADARATHYVLDYDHQTLRAKENGQPAPAAGWFKKLEWREGQGLFAVDVDWTDRAAAMIAAKEYRYVSPVIGYDKATGAVTSLYMAAIVNDPAIDGMEELLQAAALHFSFVHDQPLKGRSMNIEELLEQLRWLLNLPVGAPAEDVSAHLEKLIAQIKKDEPSASLGTSFDLAAHLTKQRETMAALNNAVPDPAKYVPLAAMAALQQQVASLSAKMTNSEVDKVVNDALAAGKLLPAQEQWARDLGNKDMAALSSYLATAMPVAALGGMQTDHSKPPTAGVASLSADQKNLCRMMGVSEDEFLKTLNAEAAA